MVCVSCIVWPVLSLFLVIAHFFWDKLPFNQSKSTLWNYNKLGKKVNEEPGKKEEAKATQAKQPEVSKITRSAEDQKTVDQMYEDLDD